MKRVTFTETERYYIIQSGNKYWYWCKDTGEFDGTSWDMNDGVS